MTYVKPPALRGGLKTRIMASIQTPNRQISVKETYEEVINKMHYQWIELTEVILFFSEWSGKEHRDERKIRLNRDYIIEVNP